MRNETNTIIIEKYRPDYKKASSRKEKSEILSILVKLTQLDRKYLLRVLSRKRPLISNKPIGRPKTYGEDVKDHIMKLHVLMEMISPKRMVVAIPLWLPYYEMHFGKLRKELKEQILNISSSTIGRILKAHRDVKRGRSSTRVNHKLKNRIPIKRLDETVTSPGTVQADTVAHCGGSLMGDFANTLTVTDVFSNWTENRACYTKGSMEIKRALIDIEKHTPIIIKNFDTDCGSEFLNYRIMRYFEKNHKRSRAVKMRRARPYKKNDQCYVEQKNNTHVRNLFGYDRVEDPLLIAIMNKIYKELWNPLNNYFLPSFKLKEKTRIGAKIKKTFEEPKTPAQRILEHKTYSSFMKKKIQFNLNQLDPIELKMKLEKELNIFYNLLDKEKRRSA